MQDISVDDPFAGYGARIKLARSHLGWTQIECAARCGIEQATLSHWEHEKHLPSELSWRKLANGMGLPDYWLKWGSKEPVLVRRLIPNIYELPADGARELTEQETNNLQAGRKHRKRG